VVDDIGEINQPQCHKYIKKTKKIVKDRRKPPVILWYNFGNHNVTHVLFRKKSCANRCHVLAGEGKTRKLKQPLRKSKLSKVSRVNEQCML